MSAEWPPFEVYSVKAEKVQLITPRLKRLTFDASGIPGVMGGLPAQWMKVFVTRPDGQRSAGRAYTIRRFDGSSKKIDMDFVLHGDDGNISAWAASVEAGASFQVSAPHPRSGFAISPKTRNFLLLGDETGLPAIAAILEALPPHAQAKAIIEVAGAGEEQPLHSAASLATFWLRRDASYRPSLDQAMRAVGLPPDLAIWVTAESSDVGSVQRTLKVSGATQDVSVHAAGYWKRGEADHVDAAAVF